MRISDWSSDVCSSDLGYIDDALDEKRRKAVEARLSQDNDLAAKIAVYKAQKMALKLLDRPAGPLPPPIRALCRQLAERLTRRSQSAGIWNKMPRSEERRGGKECKYV